MRNNSGSISPPINIPSKRTSSRTKVLNSGYQLKGERVNYINNGQKASKKLRNQRHKNQQAANNQNLNSPPNIKRNTETVNENLHPYNNSSTPELPSANYDNSGKIMFKANNRYKTKTKPKNSLLGPKIGTRLMPVSLNSDNNN